MTDKAKKALDVKTVEKLEKAGFIRPSLEPYLEYHKTYREQLQKSEGRIEDALVATSEICHVDYSTIRRAVNKVTTLLA